MLMSCNGNPADILKGAPVLDREATVALAKRLFPRKTMTVLEDGDLSRACPAKAEVVAGCFPGLAIVAAKEFAIDLPSRLAPTYIEAMPGYRVYLHAMHSVVDWFAYAIWHEGRLERSLSVSPDRGVMEDIGSRRAFELPYWAGDHPATDPGDSNDSYPLVFHPLDLGEAALGALFGYQLEGMAVEGDAAPDTIALMRFQRGWRFGNW